MRIFIYICLGIFLPLAAYSADADSRKFSPPAAHVFTENRGQIVGSDGRPRPEILFTSEANGAKLYFTRHGISYVFLREEHDAPNAPNRPDKPVYGPEGGLPRTKYSSYRMDLDFIGANPEPGIVRQEQASDYSNYYLAHCPEGILHVRNFRRIIYENIYPSIDLVYYVTGQGLKYDFIVHPGGDPSKIKLRYTGAESLSVGADGTLSIVSPLGRVEEAAPYSYQRNVAGIEQEVRNRFAAEGNVIGFRPGSYDRSRDLIIDPTSLAWATFYGGAGNEMLYGITTDVSGNVITVGTVHGDGFPVYNAIQTTLKGSSDNVIVKFSPDGERLWATLYGGSGTESLHDVVADSKGNIITVGGSGTADGKDPDFPVFNAWQTAFGGVEDATIIKLGPDGKRIWAAYYGGDNVDRATSVALGPSDIIILGGITLSPDFPLRNPYQPALKSKDAFIAKLKPEGEPLWSTYFGGSSDDALLPRVHCNNEGEIAITGSTNSTDLPLLNPVQSTNKGGLDLFVAKFSAQEKLLWSTYLGSRGTDFYSELCFDGTGGLYVTASSFGADFPVKNAWQPLFSKVENTINCDAIISRFSDDGKLLWSTYLGNSQTFREFGISVVCDNANNAIVCMLTLSDHSGLPVPGALQAASAGGSDLYMARFSPEGLLRWGTYWGGPAGEGSYGAANLALDGSGNLILGTISYGSMPVRNAFQPGHTGGGYDMYIAKFSCAEPVTIPVEGPAVLCDGDSILLRAPEGYLSYEWNNGRTGREIYVRSPGVYSVKARNAGGCLDTSLPYKIMLNPSPKPEILGDTVFCQGGSATLSTEQEYSGYEWNTGETTRAISVVKAGIYRVKVKGANGCYGSSKDFIIKDIPVPAPAIIARRPLRFCDGDSTILELSESFASFFWSTGETGSSIVVKKSGRYSVAVTDANGCTGSSDTVEVFRNPLPEAGLVLNPDKRSICQGESITITLNGAFASCLWSTGETDPVIRVDKAGKYFATLHDINGCTGTTDTVEITESRISPRLLTEPDRQYICGNDSIRISVEGSYTSYLWSTGETGPSITVKTGGSYSVLVSDSYGCTGSSEILEIRKDDIAPKLLFEPDLRYICGNDSIRISVAGNFASYLWSTGEKSESIIIKKGGDYSVSVSDANGCTGSSEAVRIFEDAISPKLLFEPDTRSLCRNGNIRISVEGSYSSYLWSTGETSPSILATMPGDYSVAVTDAKGCAGNSAAERILSAPDLLESGDTVLSFTRSGEEQLSEWINTGSLPLRVEAIIAADAFSIVSEPPLPHTLLPGEELLVRIRFAPVIQKQYRDTAFLLLGAPCGERLPIRLTAHTGAGALLAYLPDISSVPWKQDLRIPLQLTAEEVPQLSRVEAEISWNAGIFLPLRLSSGRITGNRVTGKRRSITVETDEFPRLGSHGIITEIIGDVLLGDSVASDLRIEWLRIFDGAEQIHAEKENGSLTLEGVCMLEGGRLVRGGAFAMMISPNPAADELSVEVDSQEAGEYVLSLISGEGKETELRRWRKAAAPEAAGLRYELRVGLQEHSSGMYYLLLKTPTQSLASPLYIIR